MQQGPNQQPPQIIVVQQPSNGATEGCFSVLWVLFFLVVVLPMASCAGCFVLAQLKR